MSRSTFKILFYVNKSKEKQGIVPVLGRVTINGTQSQFSCKHSIPLDMWDVKGNCAKGRSKEALQINRNLDNIKAQIFKHYQHLSDCEAFVTAEMVRNAYQGFGSEYETLLNAFDKDIANQKKRVGKDRVASTLWAMQRSRKDVAEFIQSHYRRTDMSMLELTPEFFDKRAILRPAVLRRILVLLFATALRNLQLNLADVLVVVLCSLRNRLLGLNLLHGIQIRDELAVVRIQSLTGNLQFAHDDSRLLLAAHRVQPLQRRLHLRHPCVERLRGRVEGRSRETIECLVEGTTPSGIPSVLFP